MVQECLAMRYKASVEQAGPRADGVKVTQLVDEFLSQFRIALMMVAIQGGCHATSVWSAGTCTKKDTLEAVTVDLISLC